jgi:N-acetyltransferase
MEINPITLIGKVVRLEPLSVTHVPSLAIAGSDERIWRYMLYGNVVTEPRMHSLVMDLLNRQAQGTDLPFAVIYLASEEAIGMTRYMDIRREHRGLEIGGTWYALAFQQTRVNTECKYLLLKHAFEDLGCVRVQFKTDLRNLPSQQALTRIGAKKEGVLRHHMITPNGYLRDSVYYSILIEEWPAIRVRLESFLAQ